MCRHEMHLAAALICAALLLSQARADPDVSPVVQRQQDARAAIEQISAQLRLLLRFEKDPDIRQRAEAALALLNERAVAGQMEDIAGLLRGKHLDKALTGQGQVIEALGQLIELLTRRIADERSIEDRLRELEDIERELGTLVKSQTGLCGDFDKLKNGSGDAATRAAERSAASQSSKLRDDQQQTAGRTEALGGKVDEIARTDGAPEALSAVAGKLGSAAGHMKGAAAAAGSDNPKAADEAGKGLDDLRDAADALRDVLGGLHGQARLERLYALEAAIRRMLETQRDLSRDTHLLARRLAAVAGLERIDRLEFARLSKGEVGLAGDADGVLEKLAADGTTLVFPEAMRQVKADLQTAADLLGRHDGGSVTRAIQADIEAALVGMLTALAEARKDPTWTTMPPPPPPGGDPPKPPIASFVAELKLLRGLQARCAQRTDRLALALPEVTGRPVGLIYLQQLARTAEVQGGIGTLAERLAEKLGR